MIASEDEVDDSTKKVEISTQTDFNLYSKFPPQPGNNGAEEDLRLFNELHGKNSSTDLSKSFRNFFSSSKTKTSMKSNESPRATSLN